MSWVEEVLLDPLAVGIAAAILMPDPLPFIDEIALGIVWGLVILAKTVEFFTTISDRNSRPIERITYDISKEFDDDVDKRNDGPQIEYTPRNMLTDSLNLRGNLLTSYVPDLRNYPYTVVMPEFGLGSATTSFVHTTDDEWRFPYAPIPPYWENGGPLGGGGNPADNLGTVPIGRLTTFAIVAWLIEHAEIVLTESTDSGGYDE